MSKLAKIVLSLILYLAFTLNIDLNAAEMFCAPDRLGELLYIIVFYALITWYLSCDNKRAKNASLAVGAVLALCYILGFNIERHLDLFTESTKWFRMLVKWMAVTWIYASVILWCYTKLDSVVCKTSKTADRLFSSGADCYFRVTGLFAVAWIPAIIRNSPGILIGDSYNILYQAIGKEPLSTHHPIIYTLIMRVCMLLGRDADSGIAIGMIVSVLICIFLLSYVVYYMISRRWDFRIVLFTLALFLFYPPIKMLAVTINKDMIFAAFVGVYLCALTELLTTQLTKGRKWLLFLSALGVVLFRKNGVYLVLFTVIALAFLKIEKKSKVFCMTALIGVVLINGVIEGPVCSFFHIAKGSPREMLSLPLQQMARVARDEHGTEGSEVREEMYDYFLTGVNLGVLYDPLISDRVKNYFNLPNYEGHEKDFAALSLRLLTVYPETSIEACFCQSFGYWYPTPINWFYAENKNAVVSFNAIIENHAYAETVNYVRFDEGKYMPVLQNLTCIALIFWVFVAIVGYLIYRREYKWLLLSAPMLALWLTSVASPVWNELRYVMGIYIALPVILGTVIKYVPCFEQEST